MTGNFKAKIKTKKPARAELGELLADIDKLEGIVGQWDEERRMTAVALLMSVNALHKEAFVRIIESLLKTENGAQALSELSQDAVVFAVLRHFQLVGPSLSERVEVALDTVRAALASHGGGVKLVSVEPPSTIEIALTGACAGCPASAMTLSEGVEKAIREHCPEVTEIKKVYGQKPGADDIAVEISSDIVSPFAR
jgi:Fe-S cluster biogenesis protein NfuA